MPVTVKGAKSVNPSHYETLITLELEKRGLPLEKNWSAALGSKVKGRPSMGKFRAVSSDPGKHSIELKVMPNGNESAHVCFLYIPNDLDLTIEEVFNILNTEPANQPVDPQKIIVTKPTETPKQPSSVKPLTIPPQPPTPENAIQSAQNDIEGKIAKIKNRIDSLNGKHTTELKRIEEEIKQLREQRLGELERKFKEEKTGIDSELQRHETALNALRNL